MKVVISWEGKTGRDEEIASATSLEESGGSLCTPCNLYKTGEKSNREKTNVISLTCGIQKYGYKWTYLQDRNRIINVENKHGSYGSKGG